MPPKASHTNALPENSEALKTPLKKPKRAKRPGEGRPPASLADLPENWKETILSMCAEGMSAVEIRAKLCLPGGKFSQERWDSLKRRDEEFNGTIQIGKDLCQAWWMEQGRKLSNLMHDKGNVFETGLWYANMKNRFGWRDKTEVETGFTDETYEKLKGLSVQELLKLANELAGNAPASS